MAEATPPAGATPDDVTPPSTNMFADAFSSLGDFFNVLGLIVLIIGGWLLLVALIYTRACVLLVHPIRLLFNGRTIKFLDSFQLSDDPITWILIALLPTVIGGVYQWGKAFALPRGYEPTYGGIFRGLVAVYVAAMALAVVDAVVVLVVRGAYRGVLAIRSYMERRREKLLPESTEMDEELGKCTSRDNDDEEVETDNNRSSFARLQRLTP